MFKYLRRKFDSYVDRKIVQHLQSYTTHKQAADNIHLASNMTKDLVLAYLAFVELHLLALERVLAEKNIIVSREEIEKKVQSLMDDGSFEGTFSLYDSLIPTFHARVLKMRGIDKDRS